MDLGGPKGYPHSGSSRGHRVGRSSRVLWILGDRRETHTVGAAGDTEGDGVAGVMDLRGQQGHPHSGSSRGLRGGRGSRGYGGWGTAGIPTQWEQQGTQRGERDRKSVV